MNRATHPHLSDNRGAVSMPVLVIFLVVAFIALITVCGVMAQKNEVRRRREVWRRVARRLGLRFIESDNAWLIGRITGKRAGAEIQVEQLTGKQSSGNNQTGAATEFRVYYHKPIGLGLQLSRQGFLETVGKILGGQDIEVGDPSFDSRFIIKGNNEHKVVAFLTPKRRRAIRRLSLTYAYMLVEDNHTVIRSVGNPGNELGLAETIDRLTELALLLCPPPGLSIGPEVDAEPPPPIPTIPQTETPKPVAVPVDEPVPVPEQILERLTPPAPAAPGTTEPKPPPASPPDLPVITEPVAEEIADPDPIDLLIADETQPIPPPPEDEPEPADLDNTEPASASPENDPEPMCSLLFEDGLPSRQTTDRFAEFAGLRVQWSGKLVRARPYFSDLVFDNGEGTKVIVDLCEIESKYGAKNKVRCVVQLPKDVYTSLRSLRAGEPLQFTGTLFKAEGLRREVYLTDGEILTAIPAE